MTSTGTRATRRLGGATLVALAITAVMALVVSPPDVVQGDAVRLLYLHVPTAWVAMYLSFGITTLASALYLWRRTRSRFWDLVAGGSERGARPRALIDYAMAPVWEANNVWLIFAVVLTWTGFPPLFESVFSTTWIALTLGILGLVLRGAGFAFRKPTRRLARQRRYGAIFGTASILTPFFFATAIGGVASGRVPVGNRAGNPVTSWLNPTSLAAL